MDINKLLKRVEKSIELGNPFVLYKKPDSSNIHALFPKEKHLTFLSDFSESGFIFAPFDNKKKTVIFPLSVCEAISVKSLILPIFNKGGLKEVFSSPEKKQLHESLVKKGIEFLHRNKYDKVVLSRKEEIDNNRLEASIVFKNLISNYPGAFNYMWFHPKIGMWLGASPETLIKVSGLQFETMALAGTQNYEGSLDVVWDEKEKEEQQFVVDFIVSQLSDFKLNVSKPFTKRAGSLIHICTRITGNYSNSKKLGPLIKSLHPTPAVCGLPKNEAKNFILNNEGYDREFYTGYVGELNRNGKTNLFVNLRCMQINSNSLSGESKIVNLYIGGGITTASNPESEWEETVAKSKVMKKVISK